MKAVAGIIAGDTVQCRLLYHDKFNNSVSEPPDQPAPTSLTPRAQGLAAALDRIEREGGRPPDPGSPRF